MIELYKILTGIYDNETSINFKRNRNHLRGHQYKLEIERFRTNIRKHNFRNRVANTWNNLPQDIVNSPTLNTFKNRLDKHWKSIEFDLP